MKSAVRIQATSMVALTAALASSAHADAPVTKQFTGTLISPADASAYYGASVAHTNGLGSTAQRPAEIRALARSLSRDGALTGDAFIQRVADYVRRNIDTEFMFGLGKGARGAAIDQSGTAFDQAELMVEILREKGQAASYQLGTVTLTADQFGKWTGLVTGLNQSAQSFTVNAKAACQMLANGGIPAVVNGASSCASLSGNLTSVTMTHVWVMANGKAWDPALKVNVLRAGIDLPAAMGCGTAAAPTCGSSMASAAVSGATQGTTSGIPWIKTVNQTGVESYIQARAQGLQAAIESAGDLTAPLIDIIGGKDIDPKQAVTSSPSLPYQASALASWSGAIPDQYRSKFGVQFMGLNTTLFADEISGKRVRLYTEAPHQSFQRTSVIYLDGASVASATQAGSPDQADIVHIIVDHPFAASTGSYGDDVADVQFAYDYRNSNYTVIYTTGGSDSNLPFIDMPALQLSVGRAGKGREQHFNSLMNDEKEWGQFGWIWDSRFQPVKAGFVTLARHEAQKAQALSIIDGAGKLNTVQLHAIGGVFAQAQSKEVDDFKPYINALSAFATVSATQDASSEWAGFRAASAISSALEGSVTQQNDDAFESTSSISLMKLANDQNLKFYMANSSNSAGLAGVTSNYGTYRISLLQGFAAQGYTLVIPERGKLNDIQLYGGGLLRLPYAGELIVQTDKIGHLFNERYKGGGNVVANNPVASALNSAKASSNSIKDKKYFGVDLAEGSLNLEPPSDIVVGSGDGALEFKRSGFGSTSGLLSCVNQYILLYDVYFPEMHCSPQDKSIEPYIPGGWQYNHQKTASWSGNGSEGLGATSALRASKAIAAISSLIDLNKVSTLTLPQHMAGIFATYSLINSFVRNSVSFNDGGAFIKLPDGRYDPPRNSRGAKVVVNGSPSAPFALTGGTTVQQSYNGTSISLTAPDGSVSIYNPAGGFGYAGSGNTSGPYNANNMQPYAASSVTASSGIKTNYTYSIIADSNNGSSWKVFSSVSNSLSNSLSVTQSWSITPQYPTFFVSDNNGRQVGYGCTLGSPPVTLPDLGIYYDPWNPGPGTAYTCESSATDGVGGISRVTLGSGDGNFADSPFRDRLIKQWFTPSDPTAAFLNVTYDPLLHVASYQDNQARTSKFFVSNVAGDRFRIGEKLDPLGAVTTTEFDSNAAAIKVVDPNGVITSNVYDNGGRLLRTVYPEGNAVEYLYDMRGNQTRECRIAKGRVSWASLTAVNERNPQCNDAAGDLVTTTVYMEGPTLRADQCIDPKNCNKPSYVLDAKGNRTDYTWSAVHGQLLTETKPADISGNRPLTTLSYTAFTGTDGSTFYLLTSKMVKIDATNSTTTIYEYDTANHWALKSEVMDSGGLSLRTCFKFDAVGNLISKTEPKAGLTICP